MPTFCRHNRLIQNCTICSKEQNVAMRPIVTGGSGTQERQGSAERTSGREPATARPRVGRTPRAAAKGASGVRVRRLARGADDGFHSGLVPGLRSSEDAQRLAEEVAFAAARLDAIGGATSGPWHELQDARIDPEERSWLAFLIAYIGPLNSDAPFASIEAVRSTWAAGADPAWDEVEPGPRSAFDRARCEATTSAYRAWAQRAGSQAAAFTGEPSWTAERRFERSFERLALPGLGRDARFELLVLLGAAGVYELRAGKLELIGENEATWAAKRALGIADPLLLERRAAELAGACEAPLAALDLAFHNWGSGTRVGAGLAPDAAPDAAVLASAQDALGL
ncbi:MAG TPA: hypothetical protein VME01_01860 [Solirubrobacteraceae bacterium]|nr:hypothetical protein [Solirubrobacteraceae bacterium]